MAVVKIFNHFNHNFSHNLQVYMNHLTILTTGGTIDKIYASEARTINFSIGDPLLPDFFKKINPTLTYECIEICRKDSLDMTDEDREKLRSVCENTTSKKIIITHGTDTMTQSAAVLNHIKDKTIVLFGAARPGIFKNTDAEINFGVALGAVQISPPGVYVAMNGLVFPADQCQKNPTTGQFQTKNSD